MEKKCVTVLMTHEELVIANAIKKYLNSCTVNNTSRVPLVLIHDAQSRNLSVDDWQAYDRPHVLVLQDNVPGLDAPFDVFVDYGYGKVWVAEHSKNYTVHSPEYTAVYIASTPLIFNVTDATETHVILDACSSSLNAWHEAYATASWNRQINIAVTK